jgi:LysR family transcriptional regulator, hydrogen peroxide-inducible genes activator
MTLQDLRYFIALAGHRHFGRAADECHVSQPTLSGQLRKLEEHLGVALFERTNKQVTLTPIGATLLEHARRVMEEAELLESAAAACDPLSGPLKLGVIPTLAPYLMPLILGPLRAAYPRLTIELWEDVTAVLLDLLRTHRLDAALIATAVPEGDLSAVSLFVEPFVAALPPGHRLANAATVNERDLASDILVMADGHCLAPQALAACRRKNYKRGSFRAATLDTLVNLVAAGYGTTLVPSLAAGVLGGRNVVLRPLTGGASRTIRLTSRASFPRPQALQALERAIRSALAESPRAKKKGHR